MTISLKSDASGNSGSIQVAGVDRLTLNTDGSLVAGANPATGLRSMALATMQKFADEFGASLALNGYQKLPSGLIIQWGASTPSGGSQSISLPISFPNSFLAVVPQMADTNTSAYAYVSGIKTSVSAFTLITRNSAGAASAYLTNWVAIGY